MANFVFDVALGQLATLGGLPAASDGLVIIPLQTTAIVSDATMKRYLTVAAVFAGATTEQTTMGRKALTGVTVTVDNTSLDRVTIACSNVTWTGATGNAISALLVAYVPVVGTSTDAQMTPLSKHDFSITPDGSDVVATVTNLQIVTSA